MKISTRFSITKNLYGFILLAFLCSKAVIAQTQPTFNFAQGPTLLANGAADEQIGAKYIYQNIEVSDDGLIIDAVVTIVDIVNVDLTQANNFTIDTALGVDDRFEPTINTFDGDGYVEWKVEFVLDGSVIDANDVGIPANLSAFSVAAIDVDGFEYFEAIVTSSYTLEGGTTPPTDLVVSQNGAYTRFQSDVDFAAGIDIANTEFIVRINYENTNVIFFRNGSSNDSSDRQNSMSFLGEVTFDIEDTTIINSPPVVVDNLGNVINVNTNLNTNVLTGSSDPDTNLDIASVILIDPSNPANQGSVGTPLVILGIGTYTVSNTGVVNFIPETDYTGDASILFSVMDDLNVSSNQGSLQITIINPIVIIDPCDATASGNPDNDGDNVSDSCDEDDDNDGILDILENNCPTGFIDLDQTFSSTANGTENGLYPFESTSVNFNYEVTGSATWVSGVQNASTGGVTGDYINVQPDNTDFGNDDVATYTFTFVNGPVYNLEFKLGGLDNADRADFTAINGVTNPPVNLTDINLGVNGVFTGQSIVSSAGGANAPNNSIQVNIQGPVTQVTVTTAKNNGAAGNITLQFYELSYCLTQDTDNDGVDDIFDLDSDNDGIYDVDEAGNGTLDNNNDGVIDTNDIGFNDLDGNGADDTAEGTIPIDTLNDGSFDFQNTDSDGDACPDANEAYNNDNSAGSDDGQFGEPDPASVNLTNGLVTETGVDYTLGTNAAITDPGDTSACDTSACFDVIPLGNPTAALLSTDVTLDITNTAVPNLPGILNSVTIAGEPNPFTGIYTPKAVNYQFANPGATRQYIRDELILQANITDGPDIFDPALIEANANTDLRHYLSLDNIIIPSDFVEFIYNTPIASAANRYIVVTERNGNNQINIQALDNSLALTGNSITVTAADYFDTGAITDFSQNVFIAIYPLTALVPSGTDVQGIRITQSGASGDGGDGKAFIIYDTAFLTPPPSIELTTSAVQPSCPSNLGSITVDATDNGGGAIEYSVNGAAGPWQTSNIFTGLSVGTYTPAARYQSTPTCVEVALSDIELLPACCNIMDVTATNISACNNNGTVTNINDDTFTVDITVTFMASPGSGTLDLSGDIIDSVSAVGLTSPHTFTGITLPSNGDPLSITVSFSAESGCTPFMDESLFNAPFECSDEDCTDIIPTGNPTNVLVAADVTLNISSGSGPTDPAILTSVTIAGQPNPFTGIYTPNQADYQFGNPGVSNQFIRNQTVTEANITQGPAIFNPALIAANSENDLRHYLSLDNIILDTDFVDFDYSTPIASASNRYVVITERNGNNEVSVQALDNTLTPFGNTVVINDFDYFDTGVETDFSQNVFMAIYPLTALVPSGTDVQGIRITQSGATGGDGGDGKVFLLYDTSFLVPPPSIQVTTSAVQPSCPSGLGSITIDATDNGGGIIEYSVNGAAGPWQTSNIFNDLVPGTFTLAARYQGTPLC
ncbi:hypothetical protein N8475_12495, partial [Winogradskyella sp.]|nr:hypothetical protein [Winogradskyella sp.]